MHTNSEGQRALEPADAGYHGVRFPRTEPPATTPAKPVRHLSNTQVKMAKLKQQADHP